MSLTSDDYFTSVAQTSTGVNPWTGLDNLLQQAGEAQTVPDPVTEIAQLDTPLSGSEVKGDIININITLSWARFGGGDGEISITNGLTKAVLIPASSTGEAYFGDLAYWGLTQQQAQDFAAGNSSVFGMRGVNGTGTFFIDSAFVRCQFEYKGLVSVPTLF